MKGPVGLVRSDKIEGYENLGPIYEWSEGKAYLTIDRVSFGGKTGAILCYCNPPVHQVGNPVFNYLFTLPGRGQTGQGEKHHQHN